MRRRAGYILVETVVAMGVLSISMLIIHQDIRQAIMTRGQAQDFTTARFLLEKVFAEHMEQSLLREESDSGRFPPPHQRFAYEWTISKVEMPMPELPQDLPGENDEARLEKLREMYKGYMGKLRIHILWTRSGQEREAIVETLFPPEKLWVPEDYR